jgi:OmpA family
MNKRGFMRNARVRDLFRVVLACAAFLFIGGLAITAYIIQVQGYPSAVGSAALNQKLSLERANNILAFLEQDGKIPLTNILAPGAMGNSDKWHPTLHRRARPKIVESWSGFYKTEASPGSNLEVSAVSIYSGQ